MSRLRPSCHPSSRPFDLSPHAVRADTRAVIPLFATTLFLGSFLMFAVEPMAARQMLPVLGGTPMVRNGCVVFFQLVLLLGYGSAHILSHWVASRYRLLVYAALALLSLPILRIRLDTQSVTGAGDAPLGWLVMTLAGTVGPPFLVLAQQATAWTLVYAVFVSLALGCAWIAMARSAADLGALSSSGQWVAPVARSSTPLWTDDFTNLLGVVDFSAR